MGPNLMKIGATKDKEYLRRSILDPNADIAVGFEPDMMPEDLGEPRDRNPARLDQVEEDPTRSDGRELVNVADQIDPPLGRSALAQRIRAVGS